jgi:hypothetical protein
MADYTAAITTTVVLTGIFTYFLVQADFEAIKSDWSTRRCEFPVMVMAALLKPNDSPLSGMDFAQQNFSFCTQQTIQSVLKLAMAPFYKLLGQGADTLNTMNGPLNNIRSMLKNSVGVFGKYMDKQYRQFSAINAAIMKTWAHLRNVMGRIQGIVYSIVYLGLSLSVFIDNLIKLIFNSILIFLGILVALVILLFFVLFPSIPLILTMISILLAAGIGAAAGMAGAFCIDPDTIVVLESCQSKKLSEIRVGDRLAGGEGGQENIVTGVLEVESLDTPLVSIDGIKMSESHRILSGGKWILAKDYSGAIPIQERLPKLICLNTTQHEVIISNQSQPCDHFLTVGDWEEVSDQEGRQAWIDAVWKHLNSGKTEESPQAPTITPLVAPSICVWKANMGKTPIEKICIGDLVLSKEGYTKVKGIYRGSFTTSEPVINPDWISDGVWIQGVGRIWKPATSEGIVSSKGQFRIKGFFLVTDAEEFYLEHKGKTVLVRDFTEIGASHIHETYEMLDECVNKK